MKPIEIDCPKCAAPAGEPCTPCQIKTLAMVCPTCNAGIRQRCIGEAGHHAARTYDDPSDIKRGMTHLERAEAVARMAPRPTTAPDRKAVNALYDDYQRRWDAAKEEP